ncbi:hypothetical protein [Streptomyces albireticuli]|uniref:hypothetical protein n=1 Tax=Streptomyces albireticuli TaxID=1940 RepID=UPI001474D2E7|nr:hypothetical protein [Streptomyces albireticuli]MCD9193449.1 hypothetical protein [Streptomyces albireticuli]
MLFALGDTEQIRARREIRAAGADRVAVQVVVDRQGLTELRRQRREPAEALPLSRT